MHSCEHKLDVSQNMFTLRWLFYAILRQVCQYKISILEYFSSPVTQGAMPWSQIHLLGLHELSETLHTAWIYRSLDQPANLPTQS